MIREHRFSMPDLTKPFKWVGASYKNAYPMVYRPPAGVHKASYVELAQIYNDAFSRFSSQMNPDLLNAYMHAQDGVSLVATDKKEKVCGFVVGVPSSHMEEDLTKLDPLWEIGQEKTLYIMAGAVSPHNPYGHRTFYKLANTFRREAERGGYERIAMHARHEKLGGMLQKRYNIVKTYPVENWCGFGEQFDYLEIPVAQPLKGKQHASAFMTAS